MPRNSKEMINVVTDKTAIEFDKNLTLQDRVRLHLQSYGQREVKLTVDELAKQLGRPVPSVYQAINLLRQRNEIELEKETLPNGREKIIGVKINKLEPSGRTYKRAAERSGRIQRIKPALDSFIPHEDSLTLTNLVAYLEKKLAVEDMKERALKAGLDESVITFTPDPIAEEGITVLKAFTDLQKKYDQLIEEHRMRAFDLEAERRNVKTLKGRLREETDEMLKEG